MKTLLILLLTTLSVFAELQTKNFQVIQSRPDGILVKEFVMKYQSKYPPGTQPEIDFREYWIFEDVNGNFSILPPIRSMGGTTSRLGSIKPLLIDGEYFIPKDNSNGFFKPDHLFTAQYSTVKTVEKDGRKIDIIKVQSYTAFIDTSKKEPVKYSNIAKSPRNRK